MMKNLEVMQPQGGIDKEQSNAQLITLRCSSDQYQTSISVEPVKTCECISGAANAAKLIQW